MIFDDGSVQVAPHKVALGDSTLPAVVRCTPLEGTNIYAAFKRTMASARAYYGQQTEEEINQVFYKDQSQMAYKRKRAIVQDKNIQNKHERNRPDVRAKYRVMFVFCFTFHFCIMM